MMDLDNFEPIGRRRKVGLSYNSKEQRFILAFDPDASKTELLEEWARFEKARREITGKSHRKQTSLPKDIDLLLSVRFLRVYGITFPLIHQAFIKKEVPYYYGKYPFLTEFDLQKYYNRNIRKLKDI